MEFRTIVDIQKPAFSIEPFEDIFFAGSCFANSIGRLFLADGFPAVVNPYGTMYNPASVLHTVSRWCAEETAAGRRRWPRVAFLTLGTNHVYRLKETGEIVDNCQKRPQSLFSEELLTIDECAGYLRQAIDMLREKNSSANVVLTVSPIRYRKYGYHESQLSKATLLLAIDKVLKSYSDAKTAYFPAYEIVQDELRDYRFYAADMLHPSEQAAAYIYQRLTEVYFSDAARHYLREWQPLKQALAHKPFNADSEEYKQFIAATHRKIEDIKEKYREVRGER